MTAFLGFFVDILGDLYSLLLDSRIASLFNGLSLFMILVSFFIVWQLCSIFIFRPAVSPGPLSSVLPRSDNPERQVTTTTSKTFIDRRTGKTRTVNTSTTRYYDSSGNNYHTDIEEI